MTFVTCIRVAYVNLGASCSHAWGIIDSCRVRVASEATSTMNLASMSLMELDKQQRMNTYCAHQIHCHVHGHSVCDINCPLPPRVKHHWQSASAAPLRPPNKTKSCGAPLNLHSQHRLTDRDNLRGCLSHFSKVWMLDCWSVMFVGGMLISWTFRYVG